MMPSLTRHCKQIHSVETPCSFCEKSYQEKSLENTFLNGLIMTLSKIKNNLNCMQTEENLILKIYSSNIHMNKLIAATDSAEVEDLIRYIIFCSYLLLFVQTSFPLFASFDYNCAHSISLHSCGAYFSTFTLYKPSVCLTFAYVFSDAI